MSRLRITLSGILIILVLSYYSEHEICRALGASLQSAQVHSGTLTVIEQSDPFSDFYIRTGDPGPVTSPVVKDQILKWKPGDKDQLVQVTGLPSDFFDSNQDINRCRTVAIVLFPFHELW